MSEYAELAKRIDAWQIEGLEIKDRLAFAGQCLVRDLAADVSLRNLAAASCLSKTYLSLVANGKVVISPGAFAILAGVYAGRKDRR